MTVAVPRAIALEIAKIKSEVLTEAFRQHFHGEPVSKTHAAAQLGELVMQGLTTVDKIRFTKVTQPTPSVVNDAVAATAGRAEAATLDLGLRLDRVESGLFGTQNVIGSLQTSITNIADAVNKANRAIEGLSDQIVSVDKTQIADAVRSAVESAFKPIEEAARANGTESAVVAAAQAASCVDRKTCAEVFGVDVRDAFGNPLMVDIWNSPDAPPVDPCFIWTESILKPLVLAQVGLNLWFGGEKGTGKTQTAMQFAARTGRPFTRYNFRKFTTSEDFLGSVGLTDGSSEFKPGPVLQAYTCPGSVILLDEVTSTDPGELIQLNGLLEEGVPRVNIGGTTWVKGSGVMAIAADNTLGSGDPSGRYAGTRMMNSALLDRFSLVVPFTFLPSDQEEAALVNITKCSPVMAERVVGILTVCRTKAQAGEIVDAPSIRSAINFIRAIPLMGVRDAWNASIAARQPEESAVALEAIYTSFVDEKELLSLSR